MNSSPHIQVVAITHQSSPPPPMEKATVPEMFLLYNLVAKAALDARKLRIALSLCTPEQRQFLHTFFVGVAGIK